MDVSIRTTIQLGCCRGTVVSEKWFERTYYMAQGLFQAENDKDS